MAVSYKKKSFKKISSKSHKNIKKTRKSKKRLLMRGGANTPSNQNSIFNNSQTNVKNKKIYHTWFTKWNDAKVPDMHEFNFFIQRIYNDIMGDAALKGRFTGFLDGDGILIHCSAGVGRTGVVYVVLYLLFKGYEYGHHNLKNELFKLKEKYNSNTEYGITEIFNKQKEINEIEYTIFNVVKDAKMQRHPMTVQVPEQYNFICKYFGITEPKYTEEFVKLTNYMIEKQDLSDIPPDCRNEKTILDYNRYKNILPSNRVKLEPLDGKPCSDYINASRMRPIVYQTSSEKRTFNIIAASCPIPNTFREFYRMLVQENIKCIIMITGFNEKGSIKCDHYIKNFHRINKKSVNSGSNEIIVTANNITSKQKDIEKKEYMLDTQLILNTSLLDSSEPNDINLIDSYKPNKINILATTDSKIV